MHTQGNAVATLRTIVDHRFKGMGDGAPSINTNPRSVKRPLLTTKGERAHLLTIIIEDHPLTIIIEAPPNRTQVRKPVTRQIVHVVS
jgi:hypothetical protein